jgi:hypothetical protein
MNVQAAAEHPETWEKVVLKLRGRLMPPPGSKQPEQREIDALVGWLENRLDSSPAGPRAGHVPIQRMNRTEYAAAVKALLAVDVKPQDILPQDVEVEGFDNIAAALSVSPAFVDQYVNAARLVARLAVGGPVLDNVKYTAAANRGVEAIPLGFRDAFAFKHNFPADGEYRFNILFPDGTLGLYLRSLVNESTLVVMIDGKIMVKKPIGGMADLMLNNRKAGDGRAQIAERFTKMPIEVKAGVHDVVVGYIERARIETSDIVAGGSGSGGFPGYDSVEIIGPYNSTGVSSPSRQLLYVCDPKTAGEPACARQITENLAKRAFRRPVTAEDIARLLPFYEAGRKEGDFNLGIERMVTAVLASPEFLYRAIRAPQTAEAALSDLELASRLSFFIWNAVPDDELLDLATRRTLTSPGVWEAQVKRMLADPKASSLVSSFAVKWLGLNSLDSVKPDPMIFQGVFNEQLRRDFANEAELFISSILLEDRSVVDLLTADHTFINDRLARHYGIQGVTGTQFRRVTLADKNRFGLLGKAAVLMRTSYGDRTSPVLRGAWVLDRLLGTPPTPPPPNVESDLTQKPGETPKTVRARLEQHRENPACRQCHGVIDPLGLALENFDSIGQFRTVDRQAANAPIDASTVLPNGAAVNGPSELRDQLVSRPAMFAQTFTEKLMMYAINRELEYFDMPQVRAIVRSAAKDNYRLSSIVLGITNSDAFRKQGLAVAPKATGTKAAANN